MLKRYKKSCHRPEKEHKSLNHILAYLNPLTGGPGGAGWPLARDLFANDVITELLAVPGVAEVRSVELLPVTFDGGRFAVGEPTQEVPAGAREVIVSYRHEVQVE
jgi:hypothetical protein